MAGRDVYGKTLVEIGAENEDVVVLGADNLESSRCIEFKKKFPERTFNVGIAEANMVSIAAGLATCGKIPFVNAYAFLLSMRASEQVRTDVCYPRLNVKFVTSMFGVIAGTGGTTHHSVEDLAIMRSFPNMTVIEAADGFEVMKVIRKIVDYEGPAYVRVGRDSVQVYESDYEFQIGKAVTLREGDDVAVIASGIMVSEALKAAKILSEEGIEVKVINMHTIKPIDRDTILETASKAKVIVTAEEHSIIGGLGSAVAEVVAGEGLGIKVKRIGFKDTFCTIGPTRELRKKYGLSWEEVVRVVRESVL
ncbi:transketolase family protein [Candidatus Aerophobetes bacterium]|nr:transketolase family protein [Candidatus Aerophobetes bacterium]